MGLVCVCLCVFACKVCFHAPRVEEHLYLQMEVLWVEWECRHVYSIGL